MDQNIKHYLTKHSTYNMHTGQFHKDNVCDPETKLIPQQTFLTKRKNPKYYCEAM
jgi:hypothetical protein